MLSLIMTEKPYVNMDWNLNHSYCLFQYNCPISAEAVDSCGLHACIYQLAGNSHSVSLRESAVVVSNDEYTGHKCSSRFLLWECMMCAIEMLVSWHLAPSRAVFSYQWLLDTGYFAASTRECGVWHFVWRIHCSWSVSAELTTKCAPQMQLTVIFTWEEFVPTPLPFVQTFQPEAYPLE